MERINGHTGLLGVMAYPIQHSLSPAMHNAAFRKLNLNYVYLAFDIDAKHLKAGVNAVRTLGMRGINVSMPDKHAIIPYLDHLDLSAKLNQAVNTVVDSHGELTGYTTDGIGFVNSLKRNGHPISGKRMVLSGVGGAGTPIAIQSALSGLRRLHIFNRHGRHWNHAKKVTRIINQHTDCQASLVDLADRKKFKTAIQNADVYCDATNVGMKPLVNQSLVNDPDWFTNPKLVVVDTVYSPRETKLIKVAKAAGLKNVYNGLGMLIYQGAAAFKLWTGKDMPIDFVTQQLLKVAAQNK